ncbi:Biopolymer transport protein ExbB [Botrimarina colliarenosi]|uniref:Biopolymer transport protein ExbB n=1 Tax=Botrimarina colliarenosi TaxID=2528001 RepID=A0A5C6AB86_9BACT|nr:MotA/TolQ/ExbB proton channel family protein [Botrimarina colliarenosi]TWT96839.1 Biopolymer transport protein ExbB [Botrimarina colliarenosi]
MPHPPFADAAWAWQLVTSGGVAGMALLGVLLLLSLGALALAVEQLATLRLARHAPEGLGTRVRKLLESGDLPAARQACADGGMLGEVVAAALDEATELAASSEPAWPAVEKAMEDAAEAAASRLLRRIDYLAVIGNLAPMVGLLGTVVGMLFAFREVAATQGAATAAELAGGIYEALVTTVGGLLVAIPALGVYAVLRNRVDAIAAEVIAQAESATRPLKRALSTAAPTRLQRPPATNPSVT